MSITLLALDLDGTLLDRKGQISRENRRAVAEAQAAGLEVVLITGRSWRSAQPYYEALSLTGPAICYLGALVVADGSGRILHHRPLTETAWERLRRFALSEALPVTACIGADQAVVDGQLPERELFAADTAFATCRADDFTDWEGWNPYTVMAPDLAPCRAAPIMVAVYGDRAVGRVQESFPGGLPDSQFDLTDKIAGETVLHIWHAEADKGLALSRFCRERSLLPEQVAAIGDAPMDIGMIRCAGIGVAVPDGDQALRQAADWVLKPAAAIRRILAERVR
jgi:Cof subfamily protein (haloacid dehalogenase superfamily)